MAMVEPFMSVVHGGRVTNLLDPDNTIRSIHIAAGLGASSAHTWLKLPVVDELARVMEATTMPTLLLGGDPQGDPVETYAAWGKALELPAVRGLVIGRALLFPPDGDVAGAVDIAARAGARRQPGVSMTGSGPRWFLPSGDARRDGCDVLVDDTLPGWQHTGLRVVSLDAGERWSVHEPGWEYVVLPLAGAASVACTDPGGTKHEARLRGRESVFAGRTDVAYVPAGSSLEVTGTATRSRIAICAARVRGGSRPAAGFRHVTAEEVPVELPGCRQLLPRGPQLRRAPDARRGLDHRGRGGHPGRQLELLPAAQARPGARRGRDRARGDLLLRDPGRGAGPRRWARPTRSGTSGSTAPRSGPSTSSRRCAPETWSWCRTAGTARPWPRPATTCTT